jgi:Na+:H+ antiporter, NhaA family
MVKKFKNTVNILQEFSIPLIIGVLAGLFHANTNFEGYHHIIHHPMLWHHKFTSLHFLINDSFMCFFFAVAAKEIVESFLPNGSLNPVKKAINPLLGTLGGVVGPIVVFFLFTGLLGQTHLNNGWGIPTATDIALAWLAARMIFGKGHPAINFLLLLAIVDDAIGLGIIAIFYGDPAHPAKPIFLLLLLLGIGIAYLFRKKGIESWQLYVVVPGALSWWGLYLAHLHPALALVFIIPFLPASKTSPGLYTDVYKSEELSNITKIDESGHDNHSPLDRFEHSIKLFVDFGLFFFAYANAGVMFDSVGPITWIILASLIIGKTIGICLFSGIGIALGIPLPDGMTIKHLFVVGIIAGIGLTVALFVSGAAYQGDLIAAQGPAKMGALFSGGAFIVAFAVARLLGIKANKE